MRTPILTVCIALIGASGPEVVYSQTPASPATSTQSRGTSHDRFRRSGVFRHEGRPRTQDTLAEAPAGFDSQTNGLDPQGPSYETLDEGTAVPLRSFNDNRFVFEEVETAADGLGPTYNAQSCRECHQNVVTGGASQVTEHRSGRLNGDQFFESLGGTLIASRATSPDLVEQIAVSDGIRTFRISTNTLGDGYVEAVSNDTLIAIRDAQPATMRGTAILVPVLEGDGTDRVGRFGWKSQHASLQSFAADAYVNEMGVTSPLIPDENTANGRWVGYGSGYDPKPDPEDDGKDVLAFAGFMRGTKAPSRGTITQDVLAGEQLFKQVGCATCHVASMTTARTGTVINSGSFTVPPALGNKIFHPYSDFLLHDIGTGDGIPIKADAAFASTASQIRTAPLWALRTRNRLMHDGLTFTTMDAIERHAGQATAVTAQFNALSAEEQRVVYAFLSSL
jgi:CxxC motif-containing protein (DUF1111 family)